MNKISVVATASIQRNDTAISFGEPWPELIASIRRCGVMTPVHCREDYEGTPRLLHGARRLKAAAVIGLEQLPVMMVTGYEEPVDQAVFYLEANIGRALNLVEWARLLRFYGQLPSLDALITESLRRQYGSKPNTRLLDRAAWLDRLDDELKAAFIAVDLTFKDCDLLSLLPDEEAAAAIRLFKQVRFSAGQRRRFLELLADTVRAGGPDISSFLQLGDKGELPASGEMIDTLMHHRFPEHASRLVKLSDAKKRLPGGVTISVDDSMESLSARLTVNLRLDQSEQLRSRLTRPEVIEVVEALWRIIS